MKAKFVNEKFHVHKWEVEEPGLTAALIANIDKIRKCSICDEKQVRSAEFPHLWSKVKS